MLNFKSVKEVVDFSNALASLEKNIQEDIILACERGEPKDWESVSIALAELPYDSPIYELLAFRYNEHFSDPDLPKLTLVPT